MNSPSNNIINVTREKNVTEYENINKKTLKEIKYIELLDAKKENPRQRHEIYSK